MSPIPEEELNIHDVLLSHNLELVEQENDEILIRPSSAIRRKKQEKLILYPFFFILMAYLFIRGISIAFLIGVIVILINLIAQSKSKPTFSIDTIHLSPLGIEIKTKNKVERVDINDFSVFEVEIQPYERSETYGSIVVIKKDGSQTELLKLSDNDEIILIEDLYCITNYLDDKVRAFNK